MCSSSSKREATCFFCEEDFRLFIKNADKPFFLISKPNLLQFLFRKGRVRYLIGLL